MEAFASFAGVPPSGLALSPVRVLCAFVVSPAAACGAAQKNGEVVGPAGGETGEPRCLAEVYYAA